jgi:hypothetical protein
MCSIGCFLCFFRRMTNQFVVICYQRREATGRVKQQPDPGDFVFLSNLISIIAPSNLWRKRSLSTSQSEMESSHNSSSRRVSPMLSWYLLHQELLHQARFFLRGCGTLAESVPFVPQRSHGTEKIKLAIDLFSTRNQGFFYRTSLSKLCASRWTKPIASRANQFNFEGLCYMYSQGYQGNSKIPAWCTRQAVRGYSSSGRTMPHGYVITRLH